MPRSDKPSITVSVGRQGLQPVDAYGQEILSGFALGSRLTIEISQERSKSQNAAFWAILSRVIDCQDVFPNSKALCNALLIHLGYVHSFVRIDRGEYIQPMSITELNREEFGRFFDAAMDVICREIVPGLDRDALVNERSFRMTSAA